MRPRKIKIGIEVGHVTRDSDITFKVKRSKVNLQGAGAYCGGLPQSLLVLFFNVERRHLRYRGRGNKKLVKKINAGMTVIIIIIIIIITIIEEN